MISVALACVLAGAVLGLRFRVFVLVLALPVACVAIGVPALIEHDVLTAVWRVGAGLVLLQVGYFAGVVVQFVMLGARRTGPSSTALQQST
ncbi:MAG: hypothetical protein GY844_17305 [Bradyrhizobium sp.]|nr:hypothetical protein [Bradyrhizobium sp.]